MAHMVYIVYMVYIVSVPYIFSLAKNLNAAITWWKNDQPYDETVVQMMVYRPSAL